MLDALLCTLNIDQIHSALRNAGYPLHEIIQYTELEFDAKIGPADTEEPTHRYHVWNVRSEVFEIDVRWCPGHMAVMAYKKQRIGHNVPSPSVRRSRRIDVHV